MNNNIFNFDLTTVDSSIKNLNKDDFVSQVKPLIEEIVKERFPGNKSKQIVKVYKDRIAFAAPCCGDSASRNSLKRGNIILEGKFTGYYKCFNCGTFMRVDKFLSQYNKSCSLDIINYIVDNSIDTYNIKHDSSINTLFDIENIESYCIDIDYLKNCLGLQNIDNDHKNNGYYFLVKRNQFNFEKFLYDEKLNRLFILNLTPNKKVLGLQIRLLNKYIPHNEPKYKTYTLSNIYKLLFKINKDIPDNLDTLSMLFNICLVDINKPIIVLEGPLDSFLIKNSIATTGANKHLNIDLLFYYLYDSDETGTKNAINKLNEGYYVFLWNKLKNDLNLPRMKKWDWNNVVDYCRNNNIKIPNPLLYFSNSEFDLLDI